MTTPTDSFSSLAEALESHEIDLPEDIVAQVDAYRQALWNWNERINLTRHTTFDKFVSRDICDTLQLAELLEPRERILDIGSGGGVPGLLLSILRPDLNVSVCDSVRKKAGVLEDLVDSLGLSAKVYASRAEEILEITTFDTLVARAVASLKKMLTWVKPHWDAFDRMLLVKGKSWIDERGEARHFGLLKGLELRCAAKYASRGFGESVVLSVSRNE